MFPDLEFIKTMLNGLRSRIEKVENWVVSFVRANRPNWVQNDPDALDYVKGRTHYEVNGKVVQLPPKFLPSPTSNTVGAIKADSAKTTDIQPVRLGTDGKLYSSGIPIFTTSGTGRAYTANVPEITELVDGMLVVMIPHAASGSTSPTLNINGLGAHQIRRFKSSGSSNNYSASYTNWLYPGVPVLIVYSSGYWSVCNLTKPDASDLLGQVSALHGGTGVSSLKQGSYLVGNGIGKVLQKTPPEVLADIGAIPVPATASVGQVIAVKAVDADGKPTEWETADMAGGDLSWIEVADITTEEQTKKLIISTDKDGRPISQYNALEMIFSILFPADATQTSDNGSTWIYPYPKMGENAYRYIATISTWKTIERTLTHAWAGLPRVPWSSAMAAQTTFGTVDTNGDVDFMSGLCVYINQSGDHIPAGTRVRIAVLSKGVTA